MYQSEIYSQKVTTYVPPKRPAFPKGARLGDEQNWFGRIMMEVCRRLMNAIRDRFYFQE